VQLAPMQPRLATQYPPDMAYDDDVRREVLAYFAQVQKNPLAGDAVENCKAVWTTLKKLYVADPANLDKIAAWGYCDVENERNQARHFMGNIMPSIAALDLQPADYKKVIMPVLALHGDKDRSAPIGGSRDWAFLLPYGRYITLPNVGHAPWIEAPQVVLPAIATFLNGRWPSGTTQVLRI
jgi:pimeloyl-ACP methyl ester carboxylesterase